MADIFKTDFSKSKRALLIINPKAGRTTNEAKINSIKRTLEKYGFEYDLMLTGYAKHTTVLVLEYGEKYDLVICSGGDGTLNETVAGVMQLKRKPIIGYIPAGTTNDFAKTTFLPKLIEPSVRMMAQGKTQMMDCGVFNGEKYFVYVASFGAFTTVSYQTRQEVKNVFGKSAYIFDGIKSIKDIRPYHARVITDDTVYEDDFIFASVTNSLSVGGVMNLPMDMVNLSDGKFEVLLIKDPENPQDLADTIHACMDFDYENNNVILTQSSNVHIVLDEGAPFTTDGEYAGTHKDVTIENRNPGYELLVP